MEHKTLHYINCVLSTSGLIASLYVLGWVDHENHVIVGTFCFILFLAGLLASTINYNVKTNKSKG